MTLISVNSKFSDLVDLSFMVPILELVMTH